MVLSTERENRGGWRSKREKKEKGGQRVADTRGSEERGANHKARCSQEVAGGQTGRPRS